MEGLEGQVQYKLELREGGSVLIHFQAQVRPDEKQCGRLSKFLQDRKCILSVVPPGADAEDAGPLSRAGDGEQAEGGEGGEAGGKRKRRGTTH